MSNCQIRCPGPSPVQCFPPSLVHHDSWEQFHNSEREQVPLLSSGRPKRKIWGISGQPASLQLILEIISRHTKDKKVSRSSQNRLTKGETCLSNPITFCNEEQARARCHTICEPRHVTCLHDLFFLLRQRMQCWAQVMVDPKG